MKKITLFLLIIMSMSIGYAQTTDSISYRDVYNFDVGDEFHYYTSGRQNNQHEVSKILAKTVSSSGNTITYNIETKIKVVFPGGGSTFYENTSPISYDVSKYFRGNYTYDSCYSDSTAEFCEHRHNLIFQDSTLNYKKAYESYTLNSAQSLITGTFHKYLADCNKYIIGLGLVLTYSEGHPAYFRKRLVYYKKGAETWGTPNIFNTGISDNWGINTDKLSVYPNPTYGNMTIQLPEGNKINIIYIFSVQGQLLKSFNYTNIDITELPKGIYLLEAILDNDTSFRKKIIKE